MIGSKLGGMEWNKGTAIATKTGRNTYLLTRNPPSAPVQQAQAPVSVPLVVGMTLTAAQAAILDAGLTVGTITGGGSMVLAQDPAPFTNVPPGTPVNLTV